MESLSLSTSSMASGLRPQPRIRSFSCLYSLIFFCQINRIDVNLQLQNFLNIVDENSADKIPSNKEMGIKVPSLIPIRVKLNLKQADR